MLAISQQGIDTPQFIGIGDAQRRARNNRILGCLQEIEGMRPDEHRAATGRGLDQVLPAQRQRAAANEKQDRQGLK